MLHLLIIPAIILLSFTYRLRGGGYYNFGSDIIARACWSISMALGYFMIATTNTSLIYAAALVVTGYLSMALVPHAYCQNMGRWPAPQKKWPSFFMPTIDQATWTGWPQWKRAAYDVGSMAGVCMFRGLIVFLPYAAIALFVSPAISGIEAVISHLANAIFGIKVFSYSALDALFALISIMILSPFGYLLGSFIPFSLPSNGAKSAEWGETLTGAAWAISLIVLSLL